MVGILIKYVKLLSRGQLFVTPWTVAYQAPPSIGFSRQEYWSGLPFPSPGDLPNPGIEPGSSVLQADALWSEPPGKPQDILSKHYIRRIIKILGIRGGGVINSTRGRWYLSRILMKKWEVRAVLAYGPEHILTWKPVGLCHLKNGDSIMAKVESRTCM